MFHAHKSQQGFGDTEIVEKERAGVALKEIENGRKKKKKQKTKKTPKKPNPAPLPERQRIQSTTVESFLQSPLCFIFLPSHPLRIPSHSFKFFSRTRPPPRPSPPALRAERAGGNPEGSAAAAASLSPLAAREVRPAGGSLQLLSTSADPLGEATRFLRVSPRG